MPCPRCGHADTTTIPTPEGPHFGKLVCGGPGQHFLGWAPKPADDVRDFDLPAGIEDDSPLPDLLGTPFQVASAKDWRRVKLRDWAEVFPPTTIRALRSIDDATWWLANRARSADQIRYPVAWRKKP